MSGSRHACESDGGSRRVDRASRGSKPARAVPDYAALALAIADLDDARAVIRSLDSAIAALGALRHAAAQACLPPLFHQWLDSCCDIRDPAGRAPFAQLYEHFTTYAAGFAAGETMSRTAFGRALRLAGLDAVKDGRGTRWRRGITLRIGIAFPIAAGLLPPGDFAGPFPPDGPLLGEPAVDDDDDTVSGFQ